MESYDSWNHKNLCPPGPPASVPVSLVTARCLSLCRCTAPTARPATPTTPPSRSRRPPGRPRRVWRPLAKESTGQRRSRTHLQQQQHQRLSSRLPPRLATRRATSTGRCPRPSSEPRTLTPWVAPRHRRLRGAATASTGTLSRPRPLPSRPSPAPTE